MGETHLRGILTMLVAVGFFAAMDAVLKFFAGHYPPLQVGAMRGAASLPFVLGLVAATGRWQDLRPVNWRLHLLRGLLSVVMIGGFVYAVSLLSLADAYAIFFVAPLMVTALAMPLLGEQVGWRRWVAIGIGFSGVLWMIQPSGSALTLAGALAAMAAALAYALSVITSRVLTRTDTTAAMVFWVLVQMSLYCGLLALPAWVPIRPGDWGWLALLGLTGFLGQHCITEAFRYAPASVIAPFEYTAMLWAVALDWLVWATLPSAAVYTGGSVVVACGLYLLWRERQLQIALAAAAAPPAR